jgi:hypothetical protein
MLMAIRPANEIMAATMNVVTVRIADCVMSTDSFLII